MCVDVEASEWIWKATCGGSGTAAVSLLASPPAAADASDG